MSELLNSQVHFLVQDIVHPDPATVLAELYANQRLAGEIVAVTDDGQEPGGFAVVRVPGLSELVIMPVRKGRLLSAGNGTD